MNFFLESLFLQLPQLILGMILPGLSGMVLGIVSLFVSRSSRGSFREIRVASFATFGWLVTGIFFVFVVYAIPMFGESPPRYYVDHVFGFSECLALAAMAGWCSDWLLAEWLGVPRNWKQIHGTGPWPIMLPILMILAVEVVITLLMVAFNV